MRQTKKLFVFSCLLLFLLMSCVSVQAYVPGDTIYMRYPSGGYGVIFVEVPTSVRYTLKDPDGAVAYEEDHTLTFREDKGFFLGWRYYDEYTLRVPGFAQAGTWVIEGRLRTEFGPIQDQSIFPLTMEFQVEEVSVFENLLAPWYFTIDLGFIGGRMSGSLPFHWSIVLLIIFAVIIFIILLLRNRREQDD